MMYPMMGGYGGSMGWMWILWVVIVVLAVGLVVWLVRSLSSGPGASAVAGRSDRPSAEETLKQRYARGEIERPEFEQKLADLRR